jgi:predicted AAA+ superfamily ATPase
MSLLESFFNTRVTNRRFFPRKLTLPSEGSYHLYGARGVGKTTLVIETLQALPEDSWLYIDCLDPVFALEDIDAALIEAFAREEGIETVVLDHYYAGFLETLPKQVRLIIVSRTPDAVDLEPKRELFGLDYEEFLAFGSDASAAAHSFNRFLRLGTLPAMARGDSGTLDAAMRTFFFASFDEDESRLMLIVARHQGHRVTTHQLYNHAREYFRISKDRVYRTIKRFEEEKVIFFIRSDDDKGARKLFVYDHALARYLNKEQIFSVTFDTLVATALIKHGYAYTTVGNRGYRIGDELILPMPFEDEGRAWAYVYKRVNLYRRHEIKHVWVVTVSNRYRFVLRGIVFEGIPFFEWSIVNG